MKLESRFWISKDGEKVIGKGPIMLLKEVERLGSLNKAAKSMNMSYSKAWTIINRAEKLLGKPLLEKEIGGKEGGGSTLTQEAKVYIETFEVFIKEAEENAQELYNKLFNDL